MIPRLKTLLYKTFKPVGQSLPLLAAILVLIAGQAHAQGLDSPYTVQNITVDVSADNALKAREQAFDQAQVLAFEELATRMMDDLSGFTTPPAMTISTMIQDYEVTDEKLSSKRYSGTYTFRFKQSAVQRFFGKMEQDAPIAQQQDSNPYGGQYGGWGNQNTDRPALPPSNAERGFIPNEQQASPAPSSQYNQAYNPPYGSASIPVHVKFSSLQEWAAVQSALGKTYGLSDIALKALSPREAYLDLSHSGTIASLQTALAQSGLVLSAPSGQQNIAGGGTSGLYELALKSGAAKTAPPLNDIYQQAPAVNNSAPYQARF